MLFSHFHTKGVKGAVRTPFPFMCMPHPASATPVPMCLHVEDGEHTEKGGYVGKQGGCTNKGEGERLTNRRGHTETGQNAVCAPPYFVPPVRMPICAQRRGG